MIIEALRELILKEVNKAWSDLCEKYPKFNVEESYSWIKYWGSGGGPLSTETAIKDAISQSKGETEVLIEAIKNDLYYEWGNSAHFYDVIAAMLPECEEN